MAVYGNTPLCIYTDTYTHTFFIHSLSMDTGYPHTLAILNNVAKNMGGIQIYRSEIVFPLDIHLLVG